MADDKVTVIPHGDWDALVTKTYGRPYHYQQQSGCIPRCSVPFKVPSNTPLRLERRIPEVVNHSEMCVSLRQWLARDPDLPLRNKNSCKGSLQLWYARNFYPDFGEVVNDLFSKGLIEEGDYLMVVDW